MGGAIFLRDPQGIEARRGIVFLRMILYPNANAQ